MSEMLDDKRVVMVVVDVVEVVDLIVIQYQLQQ